MKMKHKINQMMKNNTHRVNRFPLRIKLKNKEIRLIFQAIQTKTRVIPNL